VVVAPVQVSRTAYATWRPERGTDYAANFILAVAGFAKLKSGRCPTVPNRTICDLRCGPMAEKSTNFSFLLDGHEPVLHQLALGAERAFSTDPNTTVMKCRQLPEAFAQHAAATCGVWSGPSTTFADLVPKWIGKVAVEGKDWGTAYRWLG
jgi:hypothetical protein